jgi:hypothetical protein
MADVSEKKVDESWKTQVERERHQAAPPPPPAPRARGEPTAQALPQARFDLFLSGLMMEALVALGEVPHPTTKRQVADLPQARYLIDLLGVMERLDYIQDLGCTALWF